jgi:hypothetical protein
MLVLILWLPYSGHCSWWMLQHDWPHYGCHISWHPLTWTCHEPDTQQGLHCCWMLILLHKKWEIDPYNRKWKRNLGWKWKSIWQSLKSTFHSWFLAFWKQITFSNYPPNWSSFAQSPVRGTDTSLCDFCGTFMSHTTSDRCGLMW